MKKIKTFTLAVALLMVALSGRAQSVETNYTFNVNQAIPDGSPLGLTLATNLSVTGGDGYTISNVTVNVDISGGFNGDLYAYLSGPNGGFAVLLNRVGVSNNASAFGYSDSGLNVTFTDATNNDIHYYQSVPGYNLNGTGWQPDGINIDPLTNNPNAFGSAPQSAMLGSFDNQNPDGTWTLFLADLSSGGQATLVTWGLDITTAPEPSTLALAAAGLAGLLGLHRMRRAVDDFKR